jgi:hypothetical protein
VPVLLPVVVQAPDVMLEPRIAPFGPAEPLRKVIVAVCGLPVVEGVVIRNVMTSIQSPAVRALFRAIPVPAMVIAAVAFVPAAFATTNSPVSVTVKVPLLVWYVPISPVLVLCVTARLAARTPPTMPIMATTTRARAGTFVLESLLNLTFRLLIFEPWSTKTI